MVQNHYLVVYRKYLTGEHRLEVCARTRADALDQARLLLQNDPEFQHVVRVEKKLQANRVTSRKNQRKRATIWTRLLQDRIA